MSEEARGVTMVAVGGHVGDMDLAAGPALAQNVIDGGRSILVAMTPGERGHPRMSAADYREQKLAEGRAFAAGIGAEFHAFEGQSDGLLPADDDLAAELALLLRQWRPAVLIAHWPQSMHRDHINASILAERARFLAGLPGWHESDDDQGRRHGVKCFLYSENWEDAPGFEPTVHLPVSDAAHERWRAAIAGEAFARGETYGFRYIDYYDALQTMRGCLAGCSRAVAFATERNFFTTRISLT